jgi:drug/metabolite transporter (DMT)-like permease
MKEQSNVTLVSRVTEGGLGWAFLGMVGFSLTLPATRAAAPELGGTFVGLGRSAIAGVLALLLLTARREPLPSRDTWRSILLTSLGVVLVFPLLSALALERVASMHATVIIGLAPLATALFAAVRLGEKLTPRFWIGSSLGTFGIVAFGIFGAGIEPSWSDLLLLAAVGWVGLGYAEGGRLARTMGGWRVICWALVAALPISTAGLVGRIALAGVPEASNAAWLGLAYVSTISMFLAFFAWYHGLAKGGVARASQVQLLQPLLALFWSAVLLGEPLVPGTLWASLAVIAAAAVSRGSIPFLRTATT